MSPPIDPLVANQLEVLVKEAVKQGITEAMTEDNARLFWAAGLKVFQEEATQHTGRIVIGGMKGLFSRVLLFLVLGSVVYAFGGWSGLAGLFKTLFYGSAT